MPTLHVEKFTPVTLSGNEVDEVLRALAVQGDGRGWIPYYPPDTPKPPGQNYVIPAGATVCSTQAQIDAAVGSGTPQNIVIENGVYTRAGGYIVPGAAHKIYARNAGQAFWQYGIESGSVVAGEMHGLYFDITDVTKILSPGIAHFWGGATGWTIQDCWFDGHFVCPNGILGYACDGMTVERIVARNFTDNGLRLNDNSGFAATSILKRVWDIDAAHVYQATRGGSNGTGESGLMLAHKVIDGVQRIKVRDTGWQGLALNSNFRDTTLNDLDIDDIYGVVPPGPGETGVGIYIERSCHNLYITRFAIGPNLYIDVNGEWDTGSPGTAGMNNVKLQYGTMAAARNVTPTTPTRGVYGDSGGDRLYVDHVRFLYQNWACIGAYLMSNTPPTNFTNNDYSKRAAGAKRVVTQHANTAVGSLVDLETSDGARLGFAGDSSVGVYGPTTNLLVKANADPIAAATLLSGGSGPPVPVYIGGGRYRVKFPPGGVLRMNCNLADLVNAQIYTGSVFYANSNAFGALFIDWCDQGGKAIEVAALDLGYGERRAFVTASKAVYDATYRFMDIQNNSGSTVTVDLWWPQVENKLYPTPAVMTNLGVRGGGRARLTLAPDGVPLITPAQGAVVMRVRVGFPSTDSTQRRFFTYGVDSNNEIAGAWLGSWQTIYDGPPLGVTQPSIGGTFPIASIFTLIWKWSQLPAPTTLGVAVNGSAFNTTVTSNIPAGLAGLPTFDLGQRGYSAQDWMDSDILHVELVPGPVTDADSAEIHRALSSGYEPRHRADIAGMNLS